MNITFEHISKRTHPERTPDSSRTQGNYPGRTAAVTRRGPGSFLSVGDASALAIAGLKPRDVVKPALQVLARCIVWGVALIVGAMILADAVLS